MMTGRKILLPIILTLLLSATFAEAPGERGRIDHVRSKVLYVGVGYPHTNISHAIENATDGDRIVVHQGEYYEEILIDSSVSVIGLVGAWLTGKMKIMADECLVEGLGIKGNGSFPIPWTGIEILGDNCILNNLTAKGKGTAIHLLGNEGCIVSNSTIRDCFQTGIIAEDVISGSISSNHLINCGSSGITIRNSTDITVEGNILEGDSIHIPGNPIPAGYWKMDEEKWTGEEGEIKDHSPNSNHGHVLTGGPTTTIDPDLGTVGLFSTGRKALVPHIYTQTGDRRNLTMSGWVNPSDVSGSNRIISKWEVYELEIGNGELQVWLSGSGGRRYFKSGERVNVNEWSHVAATFNGYELKMYINGQQVYEREITEEYTNYKTDLYLGSYQHYPNEFKGKLDGLKIHTNCLSHDEILNEMTVQRSGIRFIGNSSGNIVKDNLIINNTGFGIFHDKETQGNLVYHNNIIGNNGGWNQSMDRGSGNLWSFNGEGNFWNETVIDEDSDGIQDRGVPIYGEGRTSDPYPLSLPVGVPQVYPESNYPVQEDSTIQGKVTIRGVQYFDRIEITEGPEWLSIDNDGNLLGTPSNDDVGSHPFIVEIQSGIMIDNSSSVITVINTNDPPEIISSPPVIINEEEWYNFKFTGTDIDPTSDTFSWTMRSDSTFLMIDLLNGTMRGRPDDKDIGAHWINVTLSDNRGGLDHLNYSIEVMGVNDKPVIVGEPLRTILEDEYYEIVFSVNDDDEVDTHTWSIESDASFLSIESQNGMIRGTPSNDDVGVFNVKITVSDNAGSKDTVSFSLEVLNTNDAPTITGKWPGTINEDEETIIPLEYMDIDPGDPGIIWSMETGPDFATIDNKGSRIVLRPHNEDIGVHTVRINAVDSSGGIDSREHSFVVLNINDPPTARDDQLEIRINEDSVGHLFKISEWFNDVDPEEELEYSLPNWENVGFSFNEFGNILITPDPDWNGILEGNLIASDGVANVSKEMKLIVEPVPDVPRIISVEADRKDIKAGEGITLNVNVVDADIPYGDQLSISWTSSIDGEIGTGPNITVDLTPGTHTISVFVTDSTENLETGSISSIIVSEEEGSKMGSALLVASILIILLIIGLALLFVMRGKRRSGPYAGSDRSPALPGTMVDTQPLTGRPTSGDLPPSQAEKWEETSNVDVSYRRPEKKS